MNKKGMIFTMMAIFLLSFFLITYLVYSVYHDREAVSKRVETMNNFVSSIEKDVSRQMYISGYRAILSVENYITSNGNFINNSEDSIRESLVNGTLYSQQMELMEGYKVSDWNSKISELGNKLNLNINYTLIDLEVKQIDPWKITIETNVNLYITDKGNLASWNKTEIISSDIDIAGFEDPLYLLNTNGKVTNKINQSNFVFSTDLANLTIQSQNSLYIHTETSPSFLNRLEGKVTPSQYGIESLVYLPEISSQGIAVKDKSCVDYIYFSSQTPTSHSITGMPAWFKLDDSHINIYGVSGLEE